MAKECILAYVTEEVAGWEDVGVAEVNLVMLKRWIPEREREVAGEDG